ncbi:hypothetical protein RD792_002363 [Penstemon davidsonii]|uniref:Uncharacterized protein n=1 Tax=Penstemon davidsonii TaxID=160366 RepID=A0ABR0DS08_9LAMI|nr:hypothetical protein RD792_002363 [Penstemon davidsonii]
MHVAMEVLTVQQYNQAELATSQVLYATMPRHGNCRYASSTSTTPSTPTIPMTPTPTIPMTPPSMPTPVTPYTPGGGGNGFGSDPTGGYDYGSPTGTPSSAATMSLNLLLLMAMNFLISSTAVANYF